MNQNLFRPIEGVKYQKLSGRQSTQGENILKIIKTHDCQSSLLISIKNVLDKLVFNTDHDRFEAGIDDLGQILGFITQRPEKLFEGGPDNLWKIRNDQFWVISCKNEVIRDRGISITEVNQLLGHIHWFEERYPEASYVPIFCHPSNNLLEGASISYPTYVLLPENLAKLKDQVYSLYVELANKSEESISIDLINRLLTQYQLNSDKIINQYFKRTIVPS